MAHFAEALKLFKGGAAEKRCRARTRTSAAARIDAMTYHAAEARMMRGRPRVREVPEDRRCPDKLDFSPAPTGASPAEPKAQKARRSRSRRRSSRPGSTTRASSSRPRAEDLPERHSLQAGALGHRRRGAYRPAVPGLLGSALHGAGPEGGPAPAGLSAGRVRADVPRRVLRRDDRPGGAARGQGHRGSVDLPQQVDRAVVFNEWSQLCEAELNQIKPVEYPLASEIRAQPGYVSRSIDGSDAGSASGDRSK